MCLSACFRKTEPVQNDFATVITDLDVTTRVCERSINAKLAKFILQLENEATGDNLYILRPGHVEDQLILDQIYQDTKADPTMKQHRIQIVLKKGVPYVDKTRADVLIDNLNEGFKPAPILPETIEKIQKHIQRKLKNLKVDNLYYTPEAMYAAIKKHTSFVSALDHQALEKLLIKTANKRAFLVWEAPLSDSPVSLRRVPSTLSIKQGQSFKDFMLANFDGEVIVHHAFSIGTTGHIIDRVWGHTFNHFDTGILDQKEEAFLPSLFPTLTPFLSL